MSTWTPFLGGLSAGCGSESSDSEEAVLSECQSARVLEVEDQQPWLRQARKASIVAAAFTPAIAFSVVLHSSFSPSVPSSSQRHAGPAFAGHLRSGGSDADGWSLDAGSFVEEHEHEECHTAKTGEPCFVDVRWAMTDGIWGHPDWYEDPCPSLTKESSFEEFQACVYKINRTSCPLPCNPIVEAEKRAELKLKEQEALEEERKAEAAKKAKEKKEAAARAPCQTAEPGEECYSQVLKAMTAGLKATPEKFPGLSSSSSFEDFQKVLHLADGSCPPPCSCHTSVSGETCYKHVMWAKTSGIAGHPDWYHGVTPASSFEEIQRYLHHSSKGECQLPCTAVDVGALSPEDFEVKPAKPQDASESKSDAETAQDIQQLLTESQERMRRSSHKTGTATTGNKDDELTANLGCHTTVKGQTCYDDVVFGMEKGIHEHPDWYPDLTPSSSFEDFQRVLHTNPELDCPMPCDCHTADSSDECYSNIKWVLKTGIEQHPTWYPGLTVRSRFEEVQSQLLDDVNTTCKKPCTPTKWGSPSLFCFSLFRSEGYELDLVKALLEKNVGIFSCDQFAVLSDKKLPLSKGVMTLEIPPSGKVGVSKDGTAANTLIFMNAWQVVFEDMRWRAHDWIIKADPDAVLLPTRMRDQLREHTGKNVFVKNCMKWTGPGWPMMFGSMEAFSNAAIETYYERAWECKSKLQWQAWGEDLFMGNCLNMLGVGSVWAPHISGDNVCKGANCADGMTATYHPFKSAEKWFQCYNTAMGIR